MTWRDAVATFRAYSDVGAYEIRALRDSLLAGMALKVLFWPAMPIWVAVALSVPTLGVYFLVGLAHKHYGWMREASTVGVRQGMSQAEVVRWTWEYRMMQALKCQLGTNGTLPPEVNLLLGVPREAEGNK